MHSFGNKIDFSKDEYNDNTHLEGWPGSGAGVLGMEAAQDKVTLQLMMP